MSNIPGVLDLAAYARLASLNRPTDPAAIAREIHRLHSTGLQPRDIAAALRVSLDHVINAINSPSR